MFNAVDIIKKKRDGDILSKEELEYFVKGIVDGSIPDYQISSLLMAIYLNGMNSDELFYFTKYMVGRVDRVYDDGFVDKHSTGGVGDKITLIIAPLIGEAGLKMSKMSGRGLGYSGGTIDKLESIPGFRTNISKEALKKQLDDVGIAIVGQNEEVALADKKIYAIRDVTGTVESIPLIASSIVSKKIATGNRNIVFDVKVGNGAFMKDISSGITLAETLVDLVNKFGGKSVGVLTNMNSPLGYYVGNSLEIIEVIETLKGNGPRDLVEISKAIGGNLLYIGGKVDSSEAGEELIDEMLAKGLGLNKFKELIEAQGGDVEVINNYNLLPKSKFCYEILSQEEGYISSINSEIIGKLSVTLGAGRLEKEDSIDYSAGLFIAKKIGDHVEVGDIIGKLYTSKDELSKESLITTYISAFKFSENEVNKDSLIYKIIS